MFGEQGQKFQQRTSNMHGGCNFQPGTQMMVDDAQTEGSKLADADTLPDNEGQEATNKEDDGKT